MGFLKRLLGSNAEPTVATVTSRPETPLPCPHCGHLFTSSPRRGRKCPACGGQFWVRTNPDGRRVLLTDEQLERRDLIVATESLDQNFRAIEAELKAKSPDYTARDVYWVALNRAALRAMRRREWSSLSRIYGSQAYFLYEAGKPFERIAREASRAGLRQYEGAGLEYVTVIAPDSCSACEPDSDRRRRLADEMREPTLPHMACEEGFCPCSYTAVIEGLS